jgi:hypothetical protein
MAFLKSCAIGLIFLCCAHGVRAQTEGVFIAPNADVPNATAHEAASFDSAYASEERQSAGANTPEADARPGTYYFLLGANAFQKKDYAFAIQMYQVSASWAYKPAEYNLGVMYARGQGVPMDVPRAMAWIALAAERNEPRYVDAREAIYATMSKEQFEQANVIWRELKPTYADEVALRRARTRWAEVRANMTGSRVGSLASNLQIGMRGPSSENPSAPKLLGPAAKDQGPRSYGTSAAEVLGGQGVSGAMAYGQLLRSNDPYDPKFQNPALGTATVGPLTAVKPDARKDRAATQTESVPHDQ